MGGNQQNCKSTIQKSECNFKLNKVTHIIFDLDGLLLDTEKYYSAAVSQTLAKFGKDYPKDLKMKHLGCSSVKMAEIVIKYWQIETTVVDFLLIYREIANKLIVNAELQPGAEKIVKYLNKNNIPMAIASSSTSNSFRLKLANHQDFLRFFHHSVLIDDPDVKNSKPAPDIFLVAASRFEENPSPSKCLVFEDAPNGIEAALAAGMQAVLVPAHDVPLELKKSAHLVIDSLENFKPEIFHLPPMD